MAGENEAKETPAPGATSAGGGPLKEGILFDFTGDLAEFGPNMMNGANLAAKDIDDAGGVLGQDIVLLQAGLADFADSGSRRGSPARRKRQGVGGNRFAVQRRHPGSRRGRYRSRQGHPDFSGLDFAGPDDGCRTTTSSSGRLFPTQLRGWCSAKLANELGYKTVATMYVNNAYGQGLSENFKKSFEALGGTVTAQVPHEQEQASYLAELQKATAGNPDAIAALSYPESATVYLKEGFENNLLKNVLFCDGTKSTDIITAVGAAKLEGMEGTVSAAAEIPTDWQAEFVAEFGSLPPLPYIAESYDAVILVALGAEKAQSTDPAAIRDAMRTLNDPAGEKVSSGGAGIQRALELIRPGKPINYQGASGFSGWDKNGDLPSGFIEIWKYTTADPSGIATVRTVPVTLGQ